MIRSESIAMIREKSLEGKSAYAISKEMGISKNTVRKYLDVDAPAKPRYSKRASKLDPFKSMINAYLEDGIFNCEVIMERIVEAGYDGKISILKDYVRPFRPPKSIPAVKRYETEPGKQAQMDWGICSYDDGRQMHKVPAFMIVLGNSRTKYVEFTKRCDLFSLQHCILNALEYFEGVPQTILTDNMKTVVNHREAGKPIWNSAFLDFANDMGFVPKACRVRRPQTKGKVERLVRYVKENFISGRIFTDIADLNRQTLQWCDRINERTNGSTGKSAFDLLREEPLLPLPNTTLRARYRYESRRVSRDGFISYDGVRYGVPWEYSGRQLTVRAVSGKIEIFNGIDRVATHKIEPQSGSIIFLEGQYRGLAEKNGVVFPTLAHLVENPVETRSLSFYDKLMEVSNG
ncbi:MAG: IS21 family transposase [Eubacteriales bacterium]|jgi:transposase|nr:IS21 family transposase [Eubacteriales bacterium]